MPKICTILLIILLSSAAAIGQPTAEVSPITPPITPAEDKPADNKATDSKPTDTKLPDETPMDDMSKLREEVARLHRALEEQRGQLDRQIRELQKAVETRLTGVANGLDAVRISVDAVKNAVVSIQLPKRTAITIAADSSAPILCGAQGCEATALEHCRKAGYETAHVVHKLEAPAKWLLTFVCRDL